MYADGCWVPGSQVTTEDFFDSHYVTRNLASLFGIPEGRLRVPKIVAGSSRRRRLEAVRLTQVELRPFARPATSRC